MTILKQLAFVGGELAPALYARVDQEKYHTGARTLRNNIIMRHGGTANRPGTKWIAEVKRSDQESRLVEFIFSNTVTYMLEFGNLYMRVYKDCRRLYHPLVPITGISLASPAEVTTGLPHGILANPSLEVRLSGITSDMGDILNDRSFVVTSTSATTFTLKYKDGTPIGTDVDTTGFDPFAGVGATMEQVYEIVTPFNAEDLFKVQYTQSADVLTMVHQDYEPLELKRMDDLDWTIGPIVFGPVQDPPTALVTDGAAPAATNNKYYVTATGFESHEESVAATVLTSTIATSGTPVKISWGLPLVQTVYFTIYKEAAIDNTGMGGFIGTSQHLEFIDDGKVPDYSINPPIANTTIFQTAGDHPSVVGYVQQRLGFANTEDEPEIVRLSRTGFFNNFTRDFPERATSTIRFQIAGRQVNEIRHILDLGAFVILTETGEWIAQGDDAGVLSPFDVNLKQNSYNGASCIRPLIINNTALYVQARQSLVRDFSFSAQDESFGGNDLTIFSAHLFDGHTIVDWAYQKTPHSIVWAVRDDGILLGLTYIREHKIWGWHRHDTDGLVKNINVIPEGDQDSVYMIVERQIQDEGALDGVTRAYKSVEKLTPRFDGDVLDQIFMDSAVVVDGTNTTATTMTMTLPGGSLWEPAYNIELTASTGFFRQEDADLQNEIHLTGADGEEVSFIVTAFTSDTFVEGFISKDAPASLQGVATAVWGHAIKKVRGLWNLEGKNVSILADGFVDASPNNPDFDDVEVTLGAINVFHARVKFFIGLPYVSDIETLDVDTSDGETIIGEKKLVREVILTLLNTRGVWAGPTAPLETADSKVDNLTELKVRDAEPYADPVSAVTDVENITIETVWNGNGRVFIRQIDPLPMSVLSISPSGIFPFKGNA